MYSKMCELTIFKQDIHWLIHKKLNKPFNTYENGSITYKVY